MGQVGFSFSGKEVPFEDLLKEGLFYETWPLPILNALRLERRSDWRDLHASELGTCLRRRALAWDRTFFSRPESSWPAFLGRGVHLQAAEAAQELFSPEEALIEVRLSREFEVLGETLVITGQIDLYHRPTRTLLDYKTTGSYNPKRGIPWAYELQQNIYAQLLRWSGEEPEQVFLWVVETRTRRPKKGGNLTVKSALLEVPLWSEKEVMAVLQELGEVVVRAHRDGVLPPPFREGDEGYWQCSFCPVERLCREIGG